MFTENTSEDCHIFRNLSQLVSEKCNNFLLPDSSRISCIKLFVDAFFVGLIRPDCLKCLLQFPDIFCLQNSSSGEQVLTLNASLNTEELRTKAIGRVMKDLRNSDSVPALRGWRDEVERSASGLLGVIRYGVTVNGYCLRPGSDDTPRQSHSSPLMMWIAVRAKTKSTWPGMLDNMVAGGLTSGLTALECMHKECQEEASIPDHLVKNAKLVGELSYIYEDERGVCPHIEYCYDLELPPDFVPAPCDGEVDEFKLLSMEEVSKTIFEPNFKPISALGIVDFLYRHKIFDPKSDARHQEIQSLMHVKYDFD